MKTGLMRKENESGKKSKQNSMMQFNSFDTQKVKSRSEGSRIVKRSPILWIKTKKEVIPDG